jgi:hypothetical protein
LTIDKDTEFLPEFENSEEIAYFFVVRNGNDGDSLNWGLTFYEDGTTLTSIDLLSPSPSSGLDIIDRFGPFNLSNDNWKFVIKNLGSSES